MKVLHVLNELKHSGAEVQLRLAYRIFQSSGIESHILSTGNRLGDYAPVLQQTGYTIHHIPYRKNPGFLINLLRLLRREQFNAVHIHAERAFVWYVLLAKLTGVPTVVRTIRNVYLSARFPFKMRLQRRISKQMLGAIHTAISDSVLRVERDVFHNHCLLVRNWTDVELFRPPTPPEREAARKLYNLDPDDFVIVTVGSCTLVKNHVAVFAAAKEVNGLLHSRKLVVLHVGTGPSLEAEKKYVNSNGIADPSRFVGLLNDVRPCLYAADAFVMTSRWEGLGMAAVEAMSTGLPAILYNVHGLRDLAQNGYGGVIIDPDEDSLVRALLHVIRHPDWRERTGREARRMILNNHSIENSVPKFVNLYARRSLHAPDDRRSLAQNHP